MNIKKDEEYFADYGYQGYSAPKWYRDLFRKHLNDDKKLGEHTINQKFLKEIDEYEKKLKEKKIKFQLDYLNHPTPAPS